MKNKKRIIQFILIFGMFGLMVLISVKERQRYNRLYEHHYSTNINAGISGVVSGVSGGGWLTNVSVIEHDKTNFYGIKTIVINSKSEWSFGMTVEVGDSLFKKPNSDTLFLFSKQYGKSIYKITI